MLNRNAAGHPELRGRPDQRGRRGRRGAALDERGTLAMAMIVLMVCSALAGVLVTRNVVAGRDGVRQEHRERALGAADVGFAAVQARIAAGATSSFADAGSVGAEGDRWTANATAQSSSEFRVDVTGTSGSASRTVRATLTRGGGSIDVSAWREVPG